MAASSGRAIFFLPAMFLMAEREAGRPTGCEQLFGVGARTRRPRVSELDVQAAVIGAGATAVSAARGVRFGGVQQFLDFGYGVCHGLFSSQR